MKQLKVDNGAPLDVGEFDEVCHDLLAVRDRIRSLMGTREGAYLSDSKDGVNEAMRYLLQIVKRAKPYAACSQCDDGLTASGEQCVSCSGMGFVPSEKRIAPLNVRTDDGTRAWRDLWDRYGRVVQGVHDIQSGTNGASSKMKDMVRCSLNDLAQKLKGLEAQTS